MDTLQLTLCFPRRNDGAVLLGMKRRGFGAGKWNGFGGKCNGTETSLQTTVRELEEEAGVRVNEASLTEVASLTFVYTHENRIHRVIVYTYQMSSDDEPKQTEEMSPRWYRTDKIPYEDMWVDDQYWLPHVLQGKYVEGHFEFEDFETLREHSVHVRENGVDGDEINRQ